MSERKSKFNDHETEILQELTHKILVAVDLPAQDRPVYDLVLETARAFMYHKPEKPRPVLTLVK